MRDERRNLLLLLIGDESTERLRQAIAALGATPLRVHVVAPAVVRPLDWLATADDAAHRKAEVRALEAEWTLSDQAEVAGAAGDVDPVQAVEDALRDFAADEILVAGEAEDPDVTAELARFGLPVVRIAGGGRPGLSRVRRSLRGLARGHGNATPFVLFLGVNGVLFALALVLSLVAALVLWLLGSL